MQLVEMNLGRARVSRELLATLLEVWFSGRSVLWDGAEQSVLGTTREMSE